MARRRGSKTTYHDFREEATERLKAKMPYIIDEIRREREQAIRDAYMVQLRAQLAAERERKRQSKNANMIENLILTEEEKPC